MSHRLCTLCCVLVGWSGCGGEIDVFSTAGPPTRSVSSAPIALSASPTAVNVGQGQLGSTTIAWRRSGQVAYITVSKDGGAEVLFAASSEGQAAAPWIIGGSSYLFRMRTAPQGGSVLATATVTTGQRSYASFAPYRARRAGQIGPITGAVYSQWASLPGGNDRIDIFWGSPTNWSCASGTDGCPTVEEHGIKRGCSSHGALVWIHAYRNDHVGHRYRIQTTRALLIRGGQIHDITGQCGTEGQPYALADRLDQSYVLKVWGNILDNAGKLGRRFYWEHRITPPTAVTNPCWQGVGPATRQAIRQEELWWDSVLGWAIGGGQMGPSGEPSGQGGWYGRYQTMAEETGFGWTLGDRKGAGQPYSTSCLRHQWSW